MDFSFPIDCGLLRAAVMNCPFAAFMISSSLHTTGGVEGGDITHFPSTSLMKEEKAAIIGNIMPSTILRILLALSLVMPFIKPEPFKPLMASPAFI